MPMIVVRHYWLPMVLIVIMIVAGHLIAGVVVAGRCLDMVVVVVHTLFVAL